MLTLRRHFSGPRFANLLIARAGEVTTLQARIINHSWFSFYFLDVVVCSTKPRRGLRCNVGRERKSQSRQEDTL